MIIRQRMRIEFSSKRLRQTRCPTVRKKVFIQLSLIGHKYTFTQTLCNKTRSIFQRSTAGLFQIFPPARLFALDVWLV